MKNEQLNPIFGNVLNNYLIKLEEKTNSIYEQRNECNGTMDRDCEHETEKLYNKSGNYKADYCKKCGGVY